MERYFTIARINFRYQLFPHALTAIVLCLIAPLLMGVKNLDAGQTAKIVDMYLSLLGIVLFVPIFLGDEDKNIRDLVSSKKESISVIHGIRLMESLLILTGILLGFLLFLKYENCLFTVGRYLYAAMANCLFLGGMGIFVYAVSDLMPLAYMLPVMYYVMCFGAGKKYLGNFYLFSLMSGNIENKLYLLVLGIVMIAAGIYIRSAKRSTLFTQRLRLKKF